MSEWTRPAQPVRCIVDLTAPLTERRERGKLVQGDKNANAIVVEAYQGKDVPYDLKGSTVTLTFVRPDKLAVPPIQAEITGNVAVMTLTEACYRYSGLYAASVELHNGEMDRTIVRVLGDIISTENDGTVDEEGVMPTPEELLETLIQAEQARDSANAAAVSANTAADRANKAASDIENATASAQTLATGQAATVKVTDTGSGKHFSFGLPRGDEGETGKSGVHVGSDAPTDPSVNVWIDPDGEVGGVDAATLGGKAPEFYLFPRNLLDNSDFANPINRRAGNHQAINWEYFVDRWILAGSNGAKVYYDINSSDKSIGVSTETGENIFLVQRIEKNKIDTTKPYTAAYQKSDGQIVVDNNILFGESENFYQLALVVTSGTYLRWAALYEGEYTAETLPPYVPKGYAVELAECQRYYMFFESIDAFVSGSWGTYGATIILPSQMRIPATTVIVKDMNGVIDKASVVGGSGNGSSIDMAYNRTDNTVNVYPKGTGVDGQTIRYQLELSADL